jgi:putative Ca2+/H+ antiporter (TMEM165/GDT1 family)
MLTEHETELMKSLAGAVGKSAEYITQQYATWMVASAIGWIIFGAVVCWSATKIRFDEHSDIPDFFQWLAKALVVFLGALMILVSVPDIASPQAAAIHQVLRDINPRK